MVSTAKEVPRAEVKRSVGPKTGGPDWRRVAADATANERYEKCTRNEQTDELKLPYCRTDGKCHDDSKLSSDLTSSAAVPSFLAYFWLTVGQSEQEEQGRARERRVTGTLRHPGPWVLQASMIAMIS